ncbi:MAG: ABC transporter permease, partial [Thermoanaerobaculia bacterium]
DLRYAFRTLAKTPAFTAIAVATLVLGIGANTAIFSIVNAVLLQPLPYADPERLVRIYSTSQDTDAGNVNPLDALDWREQNRSFERIALLHNSEMTVGGEAEPVRAAVTRVTHDFFSTLGVRPAIGREFAPEEETPGNDRTAILSHTFWLSWFGGSPDVLSKTIRIGDHAYEIVGVLPAGFRTPLQGHYGETSIYRPMALDRESTGRGGHYMQVIARLRPGVSQAQAGQEMIALTEELERRFPDNKTGRRARIAPLDETIVGEYRQSLIVLMVAVGLVLLIACTNVASLFLARAAGREREIAIRGAVGAGRGRIIRQLLTEALAVSLLGGGMALIAGAWLTRALRAAGAGTVPRLEDATIDLRVLAFTALATIGSALLFGLLPALRISHEAKAPALRESGRSLAGGREIRRSLRWMIVAEVALSILLLTGAGLLIRSLWTLSSVEPGFDVERLAILNVTLSPESYPEDSQIFAFHDELARRLEAHPAIAAAGATSILPFSGGFSCDGYTVEGTPEGPGSLRPCAEVRTVTEGYFRAMGIRLISGRFFDSRDQADGEPAVVISQAMANRLGGNPVGRRIRTGRIEEDAWGRIVGISGNVRHFGLDQEPAPEIYLFHPQGAYRSMTLVVRALGSMAPAMDQIRREIRALDAALPLNGLRPMSELVARSLDENRLRVVLFGIFAAIALLLAASGIYASLSHGVAQRTRELGVRMALGADRGRLRRGVLAESMRLTLMGLAIGLLGSIAASRMLESLLFGVSPLDPATFAAVALTIAFTALVASWIPARRATKVDPMVALRAE